MNSAAIARADAARPSQAGKRMMLATASAAILGIALAQPAFAQPAVTDPAPAAEQTPDSQVSAAASSVAPPTSPEAGPVSAAPGGQDIVVTGSRIARRDYEANSPIVTVDQTLLQNSSTAAIEQNLNKLPQFTPSKTPTGVSAGDIQPNSTNTPGSATVSLRGIGANRNLVLIDGRRATPSNAAGIVDINTIPSAAVERVEIISGGASSTYGADAVAGVTNFILKKKFSGAEFDAQSGITQEGDGFEYQLSGIVGANFDEGRGNVSIAVSTNKRNAALSSDRKWFQRIQDGGQYGSPGGFIFPKPGINFGFGNPVGAGAIASVLQPNGPISAGLTGATVYVNPDGTAFTSDFANRGGVYNAEEVGGPYKITDAGVLATVYNRGYAQLPLKRYNMLARGNYEITDDISFFAQGYFSKVHTKTVNEPGPIFAGWSANIPYGNGVYTGSGALNGSGNPSSVVLNGQALGAGTYVDPTPAVLTDNPTNAAFRALYGTRYACANNALGGCTNSQLFAAGIPAELQTLLNARANPNAPFTINTLLPEDRTAITDVTTFNVTAGVQGKVPGTDWTYEVFANHGESSTFALQTGVYSLSRVRTLLGAPGFGAGFSQTGNTEQGGFGASTATCTSGLNFFNPPAGGFSNDCLEAIRSDLKNRSQVNQTIYEANFQGGLFALPAGALRAAVGASYRSLDYQFLNDTLTTQGRSFQDQALGIYPSGNSTGRITAREAYGELLVPVLKDIPAIRSLSLELGARYSDYNTTGHTWTYKILGDWEVTNFLRIRGGFNRASRSPNIAELFLAPEQSFQATAFGDACSRRNTAPYSANPAVNSNAAQVEGLCRQLMDLSGDPTAKTAFYDINPQPAPGGGFVFPTARGNPNLKPEKADTWTAGVVLRSPFQDNPLFSRLRLTVDYYSIKVSGAIGRQSADIVQQQCFDPTFNPTFSASSPYCQGITRNTVNGGLGNVFETFYNNGRFKTSGIDANLDWTVPAGPGALNVNVLFNYLIENKSSELATNPLIDYVGTTGTTENGLNGFSYEYRALTTLSYAVAGARIALQWQHLPSIKDISAARDTAAAPTTVSGFRKYDLFSLQTSYAVTRDVVLRAGVDNLFDKQPPIGGFNTANDPTLFGTVVGQSANVNGQFYDTIGRRFYFGVNAKF